MRCLGVHLLFWFWEFVRQWKLRPQKLRFPEREGLYIWWRLFNLASWRFSKTHGNTLDVSPFYTKPQARFLARSASPNFVVSDNRHSRLPIICHHSMLSRKENVPFSQWEVKKKEAIKSCRVLSYRVSVKTAFRRKIGWPSSRHFRIISICSRISSA